MPQNFLMGYASNLFSFIITVYWPKCLTNMANEAIIKLEKNDILLEDCIKGCKAEQEDICYFWTYNKTEASCKYSSILKLENSISGPEIVAGSRYCAGKCKLNIIMKCSLWSYQLLNIHISFCLIFVVFYPHCAESNVDYEGAPVIETINTTISIENCTQKCQSNPDCANWLVETSADYTIIYSCELRGAFPDGETPVAIER